MEGVGMTRHTGTVNQIAVPAVQCTGRAIFFNKQGAWIA